VSSLYIYVFNEEYIKKTYSPVVTHVFCANQIKMRVIEKIL